MAKAHMGARVMYCGHDGWFAADIYRVGNVNVVKANGPIEGGNLIRGRNHEATHHMADFPEAGCWDPRRGFFVVPEKQVRVLSAKTKRAA
jgi:hypothetical protein